MAKREGSSDASIEKRIGRKDFLKVGAAAGAAIALAGCGPAASPTAEVSATPTPRPAATPAVPAPTATPSRGGTLRVALTETEYSLDENVANLATAMSVYKALFDRLLYPNPKTGELQPRLAESWEVSDDHLTWTFKLREGVKFHNGESCEAEAVKYTYDAILSSENWYAKTWVPMIKSVEAIDKYTVTVTTDTPDVLLPGRLGELAIYPPEYHSEVGVEGFALNPVGSGMFKFVSKDRGVVTLERFEDYWGEKPFLDGITFVGAKEEATRVAMFEAGEADLVYNIPPDDAKRLEAAGLSIQWTPIGQGMYMECKPLAGYATEDKIVRQALNYAIDKETLIREVMGGYGTLLSQLVGSDCFGYNPAIEPYSYDPDRARELLAQAGYANGVTIPFDTSEGRYAKQKEMSEALVGQLAEVGVTAELHVYEWAAYIQRLMNLEIAPLFYIGLNYYPVMDADFCMRHYACATATKWFCNDRMDELWEQSKEEFVPETRQGIIQEFLAVTQEEAPCVVLFQSPDIFGVGPNVKGFDPTPDDTIHFDGIYVEEG